MSIHKSDDVVELAREIQFRADRPYTRKLYQTGRSIVELVCLEPGQSIRPFEHREREAFVHALEGELRFTPGEGEAELKAGQVRFFDGSLPVAPRNTGSGRAVFLVALVRKSPGNHRTDVE